MVTKNHTKHVSARRHDLSKEIICPRKSLKVLPTRWKKFARLAWASLPLQSLPFRTRGIGPRPLFSVDAVHIYSDLSKRLSLFQEVFSISGDFQANIAVICVVSENHGTLAIHTGDKAVKATLVALVQPAAAIAGHILEDRGVF